MKLSFRSLKSRTLAIAFIVFAIPIAFYMLVSYWFISKSVEERQFLYQHNTLNFCLQELKTDLFYSKISGLNNLALIRNELNNIYHLLDMSIESDYKAVKAISDSKYLRQVIEHQEQSSITREKDKNIKYKNIQDEQKSKEILLSPLDGVMDTETLLSQQEQLMNEVISTDPLLGQQPENKVEERIVDNINKIIPDSKNVHIPTQAQNQQTNTTAKDKLTNQDVFNFDPHLSDFVTLNPLNQGNEIPTDGTSLIDLAFNLQISSHIKSHVDKKILQEKAAFNQQQNNVAEQANKNRPRGFEVEEKREFKGYRRVALYQRLLQLKALGFIGFSINRDDPSQNIFIDKEDLNLFETLRNEGRTLKQAMYNPNIPDSGTFAFFDAGTKSYIGIIAPFSINSDQVITILVDNSHLKKQDLDLKRLIANSTNDLIRSVSITALLNITVIDNNFNVLAGDLSEKEISSLLNRSIIEHARNSEMYQGYNTKFKNFVTIGYFKPYNWFVVINSDRNIVMANNYQYLLLMFIVYVIAALVLMIVFFFISRSDGKDLDVINNKLRLMPSLLHDHNLVYKLTESLPSHRNDEIGRTSENIKNLSKVINNAIEDAMLSNEKMLKDQSVQTFYRKLRLSVVKDEESLYNLFHNKLNVIFRISDKNTGDFYDALRLSTTKVALVIGNVNERGFSGAAFATIVTCIFRQVLSLLPNSNMTLSQALTEINKFVCDRNENIITVTACVALIDDVTGEVEYINAGHNEPILHNQNQGFNYIEDRTGSLIGAIKDAEYNSTKFVLENEDALLFYTNGVPDCTNANKEKLSQNGFENLIHDELFENAKESLNNINQKLIKFTGNKKDYELTYDYILMCYKFKKKSLNMLDKFK